MPKPLRLLVMAAAAAAFGVGIGWRAQGAEPQSWELRGGKYWEQVATTNPAATQPVEGDAILDRVEQYITNRQYLAAKKQSIQWIRTHPTSPLRDRAVFLLGQANFGLDDRLAAFYNFDEVLDLYPDSKLFNPALQRQYEVADDFLNGHKKKFLGLRIFGMEDEAVEMLYRIQQRSPGSPLAEKALLRTADYYFKDAQFDLAADVYAVFVKQYPRSPEVPRARLRQAFSYYAQFRGLRFDATPIIDAREQLTAIANEYPKLAEQENIPQLITGIDESFARKMLLTGDFYRRTHQPAAAAYNWRFLEQAYPNTPQAEQAKRELAKLPKSALDAPPPPPASGYTPATQPSAEAR